MMKVAAFNGRQKKECNTAQKRVLIKEKLVKLITTAIKLFKVSDKLPTICVLGTMT